MMNNRVKLAMVWAIITVACFSCESRNKTGFGDEIVYQFVKIDSFQVDRPNRIRMLDYNAKENEFLAYDQITHEFLRIDGEGDVLEAVKRFGEGPNEYSTSMIAASFNHEGEGYLLQSSNEFIQYSSEWEVKDRLRIAPFQIIKTYTGPRSQVPYFYLEGLSEPFFFSNFFSGVPVHHFKAKDDYSSQKLIELYNPMKGSLEWALGFDTKLIQDSDLSQNELRPNQIFALDKMSKLLYLTFQNGKAVGVYDLANNFAPKDEISFVQKDFVKTNKSRNTALLDFGSDGLGVLYFTGLSEGAAQIRKERDADDLPYQDPSLYRFVMLQEGSQLEKEVAFPLGTEPHSEIIQLPGNRILLRDRDNGSEEPDYSSYSIFELMSS
jgi:hypothetical protein